MDGWMDVVGSVVAVQNICKSNSIQSHHISFVIQPKKKKRIRVPHCNRFVDFSSIHFDETDCIDSVNMKTVRWCMLFNINSHRYK